MSSATGFQVWRQSKAALVCSSLCPVVTSRTDAACSHTATTYHCALIRRYRRCVGVTPAGPQHAPFASAGGGRRRQHHGAGGGVPQVTHIALVLVHCDVHTWTPRPLSQHHVMVIALGLICLSAYLMHVKHSPRRTVASIKVLLPARRLTATFFVLAGSASMLARLGRRLQRQAMDRRCVGVCQGSAFEHPRQRACAFMHRRSP